MSDLQLSLIVLGILLIGGVYAYNKWQERKHRLHAERLFRQEHPDVLMGQAASTAAEAARKSSGPGLAQEESGEPARIEPVLRDETMQTASETEAAPGAEPAAPPTPMPEATDLPTSPPAELADPAIDCVVFFESAEWVAGGYLWPAQQQALERLAQPVVWSALDETLGRWQRLDAESSGNYRRLCAALSLADRRGPRSDADLTIFLNGMQRLADEFLAVAELPMRNEVLARAAEIDRFCAGVDVQVGIHLVATTQGFEGQRIRALAEEAGLTFDEAGQFAARDAHGQTQFTVASLDAAPLQAEDAGAGETRHGLTFMLDVPRVAAGAQVFDRMMTVARQFAEALDGALVDDNRQPLSASGLDVIHDKIVEVNQRMAEQGLEAGGRQALRLFS